MPVQGEGEHVADDGDDDDKGPAHPDLDFFTVFFGPPVMSEDVLTEHGAQGHDLGVSSHDTGHDGRTENARDDDVSIGAEHAEQDIVGLTRAQPGELLGSHDAHEDAGQPDQEDADRVPDNGTLEGGHFFRSQAHDRHVWEHHGGEGNKGITEKLLRSDPSPGEQGRVLRIRGNFSNDAVEPAEVSRNKKKRDASEEEEQHGLKGVDPSHSAHTPKKNVEHDDDRDDGATEPIRHQSPAQFLQGMTAAHHSNDDVRDHHQRGQGEDERADGVAFPSIPEILHLGHVPVALTQRPEAGPDQEDGQRNNQARG